MEVNLGREVLKRSGSKTLENNNKPDNNNNAANKGNVDVK